MPQGNSFRGVTYANNTIVAVGVGGTILTSPDGVSWTIRTSGTSASLYGVAYGNGIFVAVVDYGGILTSPDGVSWTTRSSGASGGLSGVTYGNNTFVAVGSSIVLTSLDGVTWTTTISGTSYGLSGVTYGNNTFVAVGGSIVLTSPDGMSWTIRTSGTSASLYGVTYGNNTFVAVGDGGRILTSPDGVTWTTRSSGTSASLYGVAYGDGIFVAVGGSGILTSADGVTWTTRSSGASGGLSGVTYGNNTFVAVGGYFVSSGWNIRLGSYYDTILTSPDGVSWTTKISGTSYKLSGVTYGNGTFVAVGGNYYEWGSYGTIVISSDGVSWTTTSSGTLGYLSGVAYGNGTFVAVGQNGTILTSPDGVTWTIRSSGTSNDLNGVTYGDGIFVVVGYNGTILTSPDGVSWTIRTSGTSNSLYGVAYGNNTFVAVGENGTILQSDSVTSETVSTPTTPSGPVSGTTGTPYSYSTGGSTSSLGHSVEYQFDWKGDGSDLSSWGSATQSKTWTTAGTYSVRARARCAIDTNVISSWSSPLSVTISAATVSSTGITSPSGLQITVDGSAYTAPYTFNWTPGSSHTLSVASPQSGASGTRYVYSSWSDGGAQTHTITVPSSSTTYTATFSTQYQLTITSSPLGGGTVTSSPMGDQSGIACPTLVGVFCPGYYSSGTLVTLTATANPGYTFIGWSGDLLSNVNPSSITMNGLRSITANFTTIPLETVSTPNIPAGPANGNIGISYSYSTGGTTSSLGHSVQYRFDWGDGTYSDWLPVGTAATSKSWPSAGNYTIKAQARCATDTAVISNWSSGLSATISTGVSTATRNLPNCYMPATSSAVSITVTPNSTTNSYAVEDIPPSGWTVTNINESGLWDSVNSKVKWGPFFDHNTRTLTYQVTPPVGETETKSFSGAASFDGVSVAIGGESTVGKCVSGPHPADTNNDYRMVIDEVTAYGSAWKTGQTWPTPPNPIPVEYVTNAGYLWKMGEVYHYDGSVNPPWVSGAASIQSITRQVSLQIPIASGTGSATRSLPRTYEPSVAVNVSISVRPGQGTQVYAVEETPPNSWVISDINEGGQWDSVNKKVKWGLFFDANNRTLTYKATPPVGETAAKMFSGTVSFDGNNVSIGGDQTIFSGITGFLVDFDGDGKTDIAVWRPSDGIWYIIRSSDGNITYIQWGTGGDIPVPGDYDGDGKTDIAVWRPGNGNWYIIHSSDGTMTYTQWGEGYLNDIPIPRDYDGDGKTDIAVWRPGNGCWYVINSSDGSKTCTQWGAPNDIPAPGDYDGDGKTDIAVWRPSNGFWYIINSSNGSITYTPWGTANDIPVPGDYDGDGKTDIAVWRPSSGYWYIIRSSDGSYTYTPWGTLNDVPVSQ